jgi:hypothetical protein
VQLRTSEPNPTPDAHGNNSIVVVAGANNLLTPVEVESFGGLVESAAVMVCQVCVHGLQARVCVCGLAGAFHGCTRVWEGGMQSAGVRGRIGVHIESPAP